MAPAGKERRYQRVALKPGIWVAVQGGGRTETHRCMSLGLGGLFLECASPLPEGSVVRFAFDIRSHTIRGTASIRDATAKGMGLAFLSLRPDDRARLRTFLESLSKKS